MNSISEIWKNPPIIARNNFIYKSLSSWSYNVAVGCNHGCGFCFVPETSTRKMGPILAPLGVADPDEQWGDYVFPRPFDEQAFRSSLKRALKEKDLNPDGNRAVMLCTTTDPYQVIFHSNPERRGLMNEALTKSVRRGLEMIRDESDLNVRILTRSPLAVRDFELMRSFGPRLMFGMSIPTLNDQIARIYEPTAPAPSRRRETLRRAKTEGLHSFVAIAPTYPECDKADMAQTMKAMWEITPLTIFHEPINMRAENIERIRKHAENIGATVNLEPFKTPLAWASYAKGQLFDMAAVAQEFGLFDRLHLWPDKDLPGILKDDRFTEWCHAWWNRISEWPKVQTMANSNPTKLNEKDELRGFSNTGRERAGRPH